MSASLSDITVIAVFAASVIIDAIFLRFLRTRHPEVWRELGEPSMIRNNTAAMSVRISGYLFSRRYRNLPDRTLVRIFDALLFLQIAVLFGLAYFCLSLCF